MDVWIIFLKVSGFACWTRLGWTGLGWADEDMMVLYLCIGDTVLHSWEVLASILSSDKTSDILCDIGMCVTFFPSLSRPFPLLPHIIRSVPAQANNAQERDI